MKSIRFQPIGILHSPHRRREITPIQPVFALGVEGWAEINPAFAEGLGDLEGFTHLHLIYAFHDAQPAQMRVVPYLAESERGLFATRAPARPNPIGLSVVRLIGVEGTILRLADLDMLDGTPLLDIKPFCPRFDHRPGARCGWLEAIDEQTAQARGERR